MRGIRLGLLTVVTGLSVLASACATSDPGVKNNQFTQYTTMQTGTAEATQAAEAVLNDLGLRDVQSSSTNVDGWAKGALADKTPVHVDLDRKTDTTIGISVRVGDFGNPELGQEIISRVREKLGIPPPAPPAKPASAQPASGG